MRRWNEVLVVLMLASVVIFVVGVGVLLVKARDDSNLPPAKPLQEWMFQDHKWVTFQANGGGGLAHHPDCPCRKESP